MKVKEVKAKEKFNAVCKFVGEHRKFIKFPLTTLIKFESSSIQLRSTTKQECYNT